MFCLWMPSVMPVMNLAIFPGMSQQDSSIRNTTPPWNISSKALIHPTTRETDHTPIMVPDIGDITDCSATPFHTITEAAALEGTPHALLPATTAAHATLQPMDTPFIPCAMMPTGIVAPHHALSISPTGTTQTTPTDKSWSPPAIPIMPHKDPNPGKSSNAQDPQPSRNPSHQNCHHPGFSF